MAITEEQRELRRSMLGGSDAGAVLGLNPYSTPLDVFIQKVLPDEREETPMMRFGNKLEDVVAEYFVEETGFEVRRSNTTHRHPDSNWCGCHVDRMLVGRKELLEAKVSSAFNRGAWGDSLSQIYPEQYYAQCQHMMAVTGRELSHLAVLIGAEFRRYEIPRDDAFIADMLEIERDFWFTYVVPKVPPPATLAADIKPLKRLYPGTDGRVVDITHMAHWHQVREDAKHQIKLDEGVVEGCDARILAAMGNAAVGQISGFGEYRRKEVERKAYAVEASKYLDFRFSKLKEKS